jgi:hypothetical protein
MTAKVIYLRDRGQGMPYILSPYFPRRPLRDLATERSHDHHLQEDLGKGLDITHTSSAFCEFLRLHEASG